jgi:hypothetical protein
MNCGQEEDNSVGGGHEEYLHHTEEVSAVWQLVTYVRMAAPFFVYTDLSDKM